MVLKDDGGLDLVMGREELNGLKGSASAFVELLEKKGIVIAHETHT